MNALEITGLEQLFLGLYLMAHGSIHVIFLFYHYDEKDNVYLGWSGRSWLLNKVIPQKLTTYIGKITWIIIIILFAMSGLSVLNLFIINEYITPLILISSTIATIAFIIFYDGLSPTPFHWILGVVINLALIAFLIFFPNNVSLLIIILILITAYGMLFHSKVLDQITTP